MSKKPNKNNSNSLKRSEVEQIVQRQLEQQVPSVIRQVAIERTEIFSGPIPDPNACAKYEEILPGFTDRALKIAEKAQQDDCESRKRGDNFLLIWRISGLVLAFILALSVIGGGVFLLWSDKSLAGFGVLIAGLAGLVAALNKTAKESKSQ